MAGPVPAIHVFLLAGKKDVDAQHTCAKTRFALLAGHDVVRAGAHAADDDAISWSCRNP
ncbi:hypothetical protein J2R87_002097 [Bradyrhizobium elkanii]|nr:hypothetical protein [Bradyrhizobium elkanii]MCS4110143.1 hypothetical protein [Bradyrhizobium elkanii]